jgi:NAD(P)-dependent dehydrogenase (short-subunit alcohol dehydrogenase family)
MSTHFDGKVVLVTGGGSGIGRAIAVAFGRVGACVIVGGRRAEALDETVRLIETAGGRAVAVPTDVTDPTQVAALVGAAVQEYGRLDIAVNSAGSARIGLVDDLEIEEWSALLHNNLTGTWLAMKHEIAHLKRAGGGVIVNIASNVGVHTSMPMIGAYGVTKAAIAALTRVAALAHIGDGIRINAISPGPVATDLSRAPGQTDEERDAMYAAMIPRRRIGSPEEIADAVLWLAADPAGYVVGHDLVIDGGVSA